MSNVINDEVDVVENDNVQEIIENEVDVVENDNVQEIIENDVDVVQDQQDKVESDVETEETVVEETTEIIDETVEDSSTETKVTKDKKSKSSPKVNKEKEEIPEEDRYKVFNFDEKHGKMFIMGNDEFLGLILYKKLTVKTLFGDGAQNEALNSSSECVNAVKNVIESFKIQDVKFDSFEDSEEILKSNKEVFIMNILIPYTSKIDSLIDSINQTIRRINAENKKLSGNIYHSIKIKNFALISVDPSKQINPNVFVKGFVSTSYDYYKDKETGKHVNSRLNLRGSTFLSTDLGVSKSDIINLNKHSFEINKLNVYNDEKEYDYNYHMNFGGNQINILIYQIDNFDENGNFKIIRSMYKIQLKLVRIFGNKLVPVGIKQWTKKDEIITKKFSDVFINDENNFIESQIPEDFKPSELTIFNSDISTFESNVLSTFHIVE